MINIEIKLRPLINQKWFSEMYCVTDRVECSLIYIFLMNVTRLCCWQHFNVLCVSETNYNLILPHATALSILPLAFNVRTPQQTTVCFCFTGQLYNCLHVVYFDLGVHPKVANTTHLGLLVITVPEITNLCFCLHLLLLHGRSTLYVWLFIPVYNVTLKGLEHRIVGWKVHI